jgi:hypothetical protein
MFERIGWNAKTSSDQEIECSTKTTKNSCLIPLKARKGTKSENCVRTKNYSPIDSRKWKPPKISLRIGRGNWHPKN